MSYNMYKDKRFLELPDGKVLPLVYYADSSITQTGYTSSGRKYEFHPYHWVLDTRGITGSLFVDKKEYAEAVEKDIQEQMKYNLEFNLRLGNSNYCPTMDSDTCYGNRYRGNRSYKAMKSFYSTRKTLNAEEFISKNPFDIEISSYSITTYNTQDRISCQITDLQSLYETEKVYQEKRELIDEKTGICVGIKLYI